MDRGYVYIRHHSSYDEYRAYKIGITQNLGERNGTYVTGEIVRGVFIKVFELSLDDLHYAERCIHLSLKDLRIYHGGGTEFFHQDSANRIEDIFRMHSILFRELSPQEIEDCIDEGKENTSLKNTNIKDRFYQKEIIEEVYKELVLNKRVYLQLPTGGGKTHIASRVMEMLRENEMVDIVLFVSPRKIINRQNLIRNSFRKGEKNVYSFPEDDIPFVRDSNASWTISCCTQSFRRCTRMILSQRENIDFGKMIVWFDEAHWAVEDWHNEIGYSSFLERIGYIFFSSASPSVENVKNHSSFFGKLLYPFTIRKLIHESWLTDVEAYVYDEEDNPFDEVKSILMHFSSKKRRYGFSFHHKQRSALEVFKKHLEKYVSKKTDTKPFLLTSKTYEEEWEKYDLQYDATDIHVFERTENSMGYVVAKYSMGYDFKGIDFISFYDPKVSIQDIQQSIGRGLRPDGKGVEGRNLEKRLMVFLPIRCDEDKIIHTRYDKIIQVLKHLLFDMEVEWDNIHFLRKEHASSGKGSKDEYTEDGYEGVEYIRIKLLNLIQKKPISYEEARKMIENKKILSKKEYRNVALSHDLPIDPEDFFGESFKGWVDYLSIDVKKYYSLGECKTKIREYISSHPPFKQKMELGDICEEMGKMDGLFPNPDMWTEIYPIKNLDELFKFSSEPKKKLSLLF